MKPSDNTRVRYRFGDFVVSTAQRQLFRAGREVPLIPRYFDLLVLLIRRRDEALHRREILDVVWNDVVVSDGALSQAVRILRRALSDDPREPAFIRTISRFGYRFVYPQVFEETEDAPLPGPDGNDASPEAESREARIDAAVASLVAIDASEAGEQQRREAAETLHQLGTAEALRRLGRQEGHESARAVLRDARWDVPGAGPVPVFGQPGALTTTRVLVGMRIHRALRLSGSRWAVAAAGGGLSGLIAGFIGGLILLLGPGSAATGSVLVALPLVGLIVGGLAAAGVGAGLAAAESVIRSWRRLALVLFAAAGGGLVGSVAHATGSLAIQGLFGRDLSPVAGGLEGLVLGGAAGLGYALATPTSEGGMASPRGVARLRAALATGVCCAAGAALLAFSGSFLGAMSLDLMAQSFPQSQVGLGPVARLLGEVDPGVRTRVVISAWEGLMFGFGLVLGLTYRPKRG